MRAEGAGFHDVTAFDIDVKRGDLWVASTAPGGMAGGVHKLQLISGRALATFEVPAGTAVSLSDLVVASTVPADPQTVGGAAVLVQRDAEAEAIYAHFRDGTVFTDPPEQTD